ncbi:MAG: hypothetical protein JXA89_13760 [Anaerolineae bacterium]|nr:hypothetical protein [Anaerolineae bacterium]
MFGKRGWITALTTIACLLGGIGLGLLVGWVIAPVEYVDTNLAYLHPTYKNDFILTVSDAFALDGDLDTAKARLALLILPDPAAAVADLAQDAIDQQKPIQQIQALARLAAALGIQREAFAPYLSSIEENSAP